MWSTSDGKYNRILIVVVIRGVVMINVVVVIGYELQEREYTLYYIQLIINARYPAKGKRPDFSRRLGKPDAFLQQKVFADVIPAE